MGEGSSGKEVAKQTTRGLDRRRFFDEGEMNDVFDAETTEYGPAVAAEEYRNVANEGLNRLKICMPCPKQ
eukprot:scaffold244_cov172-Amphora_coffeaeformis.AAC.66